MVTATPPATTKTTWLDWLEPDEPEPNDLYTRDQIAEMASGIDPVTGDDLRYWEYQGILPRSVRRWHDGATRAVYPAWYADLAMQVRRLQRKGQTLDEIRPQIRRPVALQGHAAGTSHVTADLTTHTRTVPQTATVTVEGRDAVAHLQTAHGHAEAGTASVTVSSATDDLVNALNAFAHHYAEIHGSPVAHVELSISLENGAGSTFKIPVESGTDSNKK